MADYSLGYWTLCCNYGNKRWKGCHASNPPLVFSRDRIPVFRRRFSYGILGRATGLNSWNHFCHVFSCRHYLIFSPAVTAARILFMQPIQQGFCPSSHFCQIYVLSATSARILSHQQLLLVFDSISKTGQLQPISRYRVNSSTIHGFRSFFVPQFASQISSAIQP